MSHKTSEHGYPYYPPTMPTFAFFLGHNLDHRIACFFLGQREYIAGVVDSESLLPKTSPDTNNIPYNRKWGY